MNAETKQLVSQFHWNCTVDLSSQEGWGETPEKALLRAYAGAGLGWFEVEPLFTKEFEEAARCKYFGNTVELVCYLGDSRGYVYFTGQRVNL